MHKNKQIDMVVQRYAWKCLACGHKFTKPILEFPAPKNTENKWILYTGDKKTGRVQESVQCPCCMSGEIEPIITQIR